MKLSCLHKHVIGRILCAFLGLAGSASAQQVTGSIEGLVKDTSGSVLPGAILELRNLATGIALSQTSGSDGAFVFNGVKPGVYEVKASLQGFKAASQRVDVELNRTIRLNLVLDIGDLTEVVVVTNTPRSVNVVHAHVATNVDSKIVTDLPNIDRDITTLVELVPSARRVQGTTSGGSQVVDLSGNYALGNGTRRSQSVFYLDGSENMGAWRLQALQMPNPDTVEAVQVISSSSSAEFGKSPGISINAVTKSGTNDFHGTALYAMHHGDLNANSWSANRAGTPHPKDQQKWIGGTLGGPIVKSRTFFFASYQRYQDNDAQSQTVRMPTAAMLSGDFSAIPDFSIRALDPATGQVIGTVIPQRLIDPISNQLKSRYQTAAAYSNDLSRGGYFWTYEREVHNNEWLDKIDHKISDAHQIAVSYMTTKGEQVRPDNVSGVENTVPGWGGDSLVGARQHTASIRHTWFAKSNVVVENRLALGRLRSYRSRTELDEDLSTLGGVWPAVASGVDKTLPTVFLTGGPTARGGQLFDLTQQNIRGLSTASWDRGRQSVKFGAEVQFSKYSRISNDDAGAFTFSGAYSNTGAPLNGPWPTLTNPSGDNTFAYAWADFLLGRVRTFTARGPIDRAFTGNAAFFFAQDQWRVTPRLTITPGLRYELYGVQKSPNAILTGYVEGHKSNQYPNAPLGLAFAGDTGVPDGFRKADRNNVAPRLGLAYDLTGDGKTALRAGGGIYYAYPPLSIVELLGTAIATASYAGAHATFTNPWGTSKSNSGDTVCQFPGCSVPSFDRDPARRTFARSSVIGFAPDTQTPYQYQFNVAVEREVIRGLSVEAAYVGNRAKHGWTIRDNNLAVWRLGANEGNLNARRPNQTWNSIDLITTDAEERYDGLQSTATFKRQSVYVRLTYALQRALTTADDAAQEVGISNAAGNWTDNPRDINGELAPVMPRQVFRGFLVYELPKLDNKILNAILGGWQISGNHTFNDGDRLNVTLGRENNFDGFGPDRPDLIAPIRYLKQTNADGTILWVDRASFASPPAPSADNPYPAGTLKRNAVRGPSRSFSSAAIMKTFEVANGARLQLRADAANVFNHPNMSNPNLNLASADFGLIRTRDGNRRVIQVQGKLIF